MIEIERKFLIKNTDFLNHTFMSLNITQGYLSKDPKKIVRIRVTDEKAFITIKGEYDKKGLSRYEWEKEIGIEEAKTLLKLCISNPFEKIRYIVNYKKTKFEIDVFENSNKGLIIAEAELKNIEQKIDRPKWLGKEIIGKKKYYNSAL